MRNIYSIKDLAIEKDTLKEDFIKLEISIQNDWKSIKESLTSKEIIAQLLSTIFEKKVPLLNQKSILSTGINFLLKKLYRRAD